MMSFENIISDITEKVKDTKQMWCIYIAVGSAAHMVNDGILEDLYYHQYPKCLEVLKGETNTRIIHILIDPSLESPPFMTIDTRKGLDFYKMGNNIYASEDNMHVVYELKQSVTIGCYNNNSENITDITSSLHKLNKLAVDENILLVYNDFTGRPNNIVADFFDKSIENHLDHIIYGLGGRGDHGCYIDLLHPICQFAYIIDYNNKRNIVRVFNIFDCMNKEISIESMIDIFSLKYIDIISANIEDALNQVYVYFNGKILPNLRILYQLLCNKTKLNEFNTYMIENLCKLNIDRFKEYFDNGDYKTCIDKLILYYSSYLNIILYIKKIEYTPDQVMQYIIDDNDEYKWYGRLLTINKNIIL